MDKDKRINISGTTFLNIGKKEESSGSKLRYTDRMKIGEGGQAEVYKVFDKHLNTYRAMKIIHPIFSSNKEFIKFYKNEVKITSQLNYPGIVKVYDADLEDDKLFIMMDFVEGKNLSQIKKIPESIACLIISKIAETLDYAHKASINYDNHYVEGVVHGDIKPENVVIRKDGEVMIMDFGLATVNHPSLSKHTTTLGTLAYSASEIFNNHRPTAKSDLYALGITLYKLLSGKNGFENSSQMDIINRKAHDFTEDIPRGEFPDRIFKIIDKATKNEPNERYDSALEFKQNIDDYLNDNYMIQGSYKNIIGAYFNFNLEPQKKEQPKPKPIFHEEKNQPIEKPKTVEEEEKAELPENDYPEYDYSENGNGNGKGKNILLISLLTVFSLVIIYLLLNQFVFTKNKDRFKGTIQINNPQKIEAEIELNGNIVEKISKIKEKITVNEKGKYYLTIIAKGFKDKNYEFTLSDEENYFPVDYNPDSIEKSKTKVAKKQTKPKQSTKAQKTETKKPSKKTDKKKIEPAKPKHIFCELTINNPQKIRADVFFDNKKIGKLTKLTHQFSLEIKKTGKFEVSIRNNKREHFKELISLSPNDKYPEITYNPQVYKISILNQNNLDAKVKLDGKKKGELKKDGEITEFEFLKPTEIIVEISDNEKKYIPYSQTVQLQEGNQSVAIEYNPELNEKYILLIDNPNNLSAKIKFKDEIIDFEGSFQRGFKDENLFEIEISSNGYEVSKLVVNFSQSNPFSINYAPVPEKSILFITNLPVNANIKITDKNGIVVSEVKSKSKSIEIPDLNFGELYHIEIKKFPVYELKTYKKTITKGKNAIEYTGGKIFGNIIFEPSLNKEILHYTKIFLNDKRISSKTSITDIVPGKYELVLNIIIDEFNRRITKQITVKPSSEGDTIVKLDIDLVEIKASEKGTQLSVGAYKIGIAPKTIPFTGSTMETFTAVFPNGKVEKKTLNPQINRYHLFKFKSPIAEKYYASADSLLTEYKIDKNNSGNSDILTTADQKLQKAIEADKSFSEAYIQRLYILSEMMKNAIDENNKDLVDIMLNKMGKHKNSALEYVDSSLKKSLIYGLIGKSKFQYAFALLKGQQKVAYLKKECILDLEIFFQERKKISNLENISTSQCLDLDEAQCHLAMTYQAIWEINSSNEYKIKAVKAWKNAKLSPISVGKKRLENPLKRLKISWRRKLND
ncbi:MAG: serine/threonine protein kinase [Candidatus Cloacimonetes bacterium]|nr:serine/threonine protein kinase [Candidatus Cloacimonadota bacterium]